MLIGIPKEIKNHEYRVGLVPSSVREFIQHGHEVMVENNAGAGTGFSNLAYKKVGAKIAATAEEVFQKAEMIIKVKEPQAVERKMLREGQLLFTYLHLAPDPEQTNDLVKSGAICVAYETITSPLGGLPLLAPMSEVAGRMSTQVGAQCLERHKGGMGVLLGGVPGVEPAKTTIIGGGVVGINALIIAVGMGAEVVVIDKNLDVLRKINDQFGARVKTVYSNTENLEKHVITADLVVGGVLIPGATAPKLVTKDMVHQMKNGSVIVDVAIDQGGCVETSKVTTHENPTYAVGDVIHYCVGNMPGAFARTSAIALNNATLPYGLQLANGYQEALKNPHFLKGLNVFKGKVTCLEVAKSLNLNYTDPKGLIK